MTEAYLGERAPWGRSYSVAVAKRSDGENPPLLFSEGEDRSATVSTMRMRASVAMLIGCVHAVPISHGGSQQALVAAQAANCPGCD